MENMHYNFVPGAAPAAGAPAPDAAPAAKKHKAVRIDIKDLLLMMVMNWHVFVIFTLVGAGLAYLYLRCQQPIFERMTDIEIKSQAKAGELDMTQYLGLGGNGDDIKNELMIFSSYKVAREVATRMHLDVQQYRQGTFRRLYLFDDRCFEVSFADSYYTPMVLCIRPTSAQTFNIISIQRGEEVETLPNDMPPYFFGSPLLLPGTEEEITVSVGEKQYHNLLNSLNQDVYVARCSIDEAARRCQSQVTAVKQSNNVVRLSCTALSVSEADGILQAMTDVYQDFSIRDKNAITMNSVRFVDERIDETARELAEAEDKLVGAGIKLSATGSIVSAEKEGAGKEDGQRAAAQDQYSSNQMAVQRAQQMRASVSNAVSQRNYIPVVSGLDDAGLSSSVQAYNQLIQKRNRLVANSSDDNPAVIRLDQDIETIVQTISTSLDAYLVTKQSASREAANRVARYSNAATPATQGFDSAAVETKSLAITHEYKQEYFTYLLKRREELRLQLAVASANMRVIEDPMGSYEPIFPVVKSAYIKFMGGAFAIPALVMVLVALLTTTVRGRKDVEDELSLPFVGELPEIGDKKKLTHRSILRMRLRSLVNRARGREESTGGHSNRVVVNADSKDMVSEAFRIVHSNLAYMRTDDGRVPQVMMTTSFAPGAGKSFVSVNLASTLASSSKRAIWIDLDIRKGHANRKLVSPENRKNAQGLSTYLAGKCTLDECIHQSPDNERLDIILAGPVPPNPVQLLMSERYEDMIAVLRERYDFIILDSVPATVLADASITNRVADLTLYVIRVGRTDRSQLPEIDKLYTVKKFRNMCCVLNGSLVAGRRLLHGYGTSESYQYGRGYGYGYGYGYGSSLQVKDEDDDDE